MLLVPLIGYFFALPVPVAVGTATAYATLTKIMAGVEHIRTNNVSWGLLKQLIISGVPGLLLAAVGVNYILHAHPNWEATIHNTMQVIILCTIAIALYFTLTKANNEKATAAPLAPLPRYAVGFGIGMIIGLTGIGGGVLLIPALFAMGSETPKRIVGTSVIIALCLSLLTAAIYASGEQFDLHLALWMAVGSIAGIPLASLLLRRVSNRFVYNSVISLICLSMLLMILNLFNIG